MQPFPVAPGTARLTGERKRTRNGLMCLDRWTVVANERDAGRGCHRSERNESRDSGAITRVPRAFSGLSPEAVGPSRRYCCCVRVSLSGRLNARYSPEYAPPLTATMMYCLPPIE